MEPPASPSLPAQHQMRLAWCASQPYLHRARAERGQHAMATQPRAPEHTQRDDALFRQHSSRGGGIVSVDVTGFKTCNEGGV